MVNNALISFIGEIFQWNIVAIVQRTALLRGGAIRLRAYACLGLAGGAGALFTTAGSVVVVAGGSGGLIPVCNSG